MKKSSKKDKVSSKTSQLETDLNSEVLKKEDYYIENGLYIFTEKYHLKRGHCCENSCRHCPYGYLDKRGV